MSETLYRKYRPKNFSEVIGQEHIVRTLSNSIKNKRIGQAYLFTGPRGTGKTSLARIFAKTVNCANLICADAKSEAEADNKYCVPCEKCPSCETIASGKSLDIIEIDAASNTGVDNIRELRETVALSNSLLKYKIYIIDEAHMLSKGAFNALLKTLEEPPSHVIFILATTEIHKVPETILSRCQRFDFVQLPFQSIVKKLSLIAKNEKVEIEPEAMEIIALTAEGGMRDAESILGQIISLEDKNITFREVEEILGATDKKTAVEVAEMIVKKNASGAISKINQLLENGYDLQIFSKSLINYFRQLMLIKINPDLKKHFYLKLEEEKLKKIAELAEISKLPEIISTINLLLEAQNKFYSSILPQLPLEIAIIKATQTFPAQTIEDKQYKTEIKSNPPRLSEYPAEKNDKISEMDYKSISAEESEEIKNLKIEQSKNIGKKDFKNGAPDLELAAVKSNWPKLLIAVRPYNHSLSALLSNCQPVKAEKDVLTLATSYDFYREKLNEPKNRLTVEKVFSKILELDIRLKVDLDKNLVCPKKTENRQNENQPSSQQNSLLNSALEIMGGKVVEE